MIAGLSPRWRKMLADARVARGRLLMLIGAMLLSIALVTTLLIANGILRRELPRSFAATNPASAILRMEEVDASTVAKARAWPGVDAAQAAGSLFLGIPRPGTEDLSIAISAVGDFAAMRIDTFERESGAWPPPDGTILIERSGLAMLGARLGSAVVIEGAQGQSLTLPISGIVHDETNPPSEQEQTIYGYVTPETMRLLDAGSRLDRLKLVVDRSKSPAEIEAVARSLALSLRSEGLTVHRIDIPPGQHPHQWQYDSIANVVLSFAVFALVLESVLLAIVVSGLLAPQTRQIAVMKAIGASTKQISFMYLALVAVIAGCAVVLGVPAGVALGYALASFVADSVNVTLESYASTPWAVPVSIGLGLLVPLLAALVPTFAATRRTVRESLDDHGVSTSGSAARWPGTLLTLLSVTDATTHLALRNTLRRKTRLLLTVFLVTVAGIVFLVAGNMVAVWQNVATIAAQQRRFDIEVGLREPLERTAVMAAVRKAGAEHAEAIDGATAFLDRGDAISVAGAGRTYLPLRFVPADTRLVHFEMTEGRWLEKPDVESIVINTVARNRLFASKSIGDVVALIVDGRPVQARIVGVIPEQFSPPAAYATHALYDLLADKPGLTHAVRVALPPGASLQDAVRRVELDLNRAGVAVRYVGTRESLRRIEEAHVYVLIALMGIIVAAVATVGGAGLASAMGVSVIEHTRELGIMRALGARADHIYRCVMTEALFIGLSGWSLAVAVSLPLSILVVRLIRRSAVLPLMFAWSPAAVVVWLILALLIAALASVWPARRAAHLRVGDALART